MFDKDTKRDEEDGENCKACKNRKRSVEEMLAKLDRSSHQKPRPLSASPPFGYPGESAETPGSSTNTFSKPYEPFPCPADKSELGRSTWVFLHTMAAYYPKRPSPEEESKMTNLMDNFSYFYPCSPCAKHLQSYMKKHPVQVDSRDSLSLWMCNVHNEVNKVLGKPAFDCSRVLERWKTGPADGSCD